jgi:hypothetical protein
MQRHRQRHVALGGQAVDLRHQAGGRQGHALVGQAVAQVVAHHAHGAHDVVEIHQRLAHAHHHHVGEAAHLVRHVAQVARGNPHLADDLGGGQVAVEALGGGGAERAVQAATDLRGHAQRAAGLVRDVHGLDGVLAIHAHRQQPLVGAVGGGLVEHDVRNQHLGMGLQLGAQALPRSVISSKSVT